MKRTLWMKTVAFVLGAMWMLTGVAWAQPSGPANVPQILNVRTLKSLGGDEQRTFLTTDSSINFQATYYDPNPACVGVPPVLHQLLLFNLEGQLLLTFTAGSGSTGSGYRLLNAELFGEIPAGNYQHIFLVRDCTNVNIFVSGFQTIRVLNP